MLYFPHVVADDPIVNLEQKRGQTCSFSKKKKINLFMRKEQCVLKLFTHTHSFIAKTFKQTVIVRPSTLAPIRWKTSQPTQTSINQPASPR